MVKMMIMTLISLAFGFVAYPGMDGAWSSRSYYGSAPQLASPYAAPIDPLASPYGGVSSGYRSFSSGGIV